ncbi:hypothetical protein B0H14DRAFT_2615777 [Mycena olivaceomarginata]|nr:hypothetical protein B0H14DRAFT_2615777 [Mycena olivaceomarginata]
MPRVSPSISHLKAVTPPPPQHPAPRPVNFVLPQNYQRSRLGSSYQPHYVSAIGIIEAALYQVKVRNCVYLPCMAAAASTVITILIFRPRTHQTSVPACSVNNLPASGRLSQAGKWHVITKRYKELRCAEAKAIGCYEQLQSVHARDKDILCPKAASSANQSSSSPGQLSSINILYAILRRMKDSMVQWVQRVCTAWMAEGDKLEEVGWEGKERRGLGWWLWHTRWLAHGQDRQVVPPSNSDVKSGLGGIGGWMRRRGKGGQGIGVK